MAAFENALLNLDPLLFQHIQSQTTEGDKQSLLAVQSAVRARLQRPYTYLEIGSHLGGSLQPYVTDPRCERIISIDPRPAVFADERGLPLHYQDNSTERMRENLRKIPDSVLTKLETIEASTEEINPNSIKIAPDLCFVDGEHTDVAALRDAEFCASVVHPEGCIFFHDANIVYRALQTFLGNLTKSGKAFTACILPDTVFVIDFGAPAILSHPSIAGQQLKNYQAYLHGLDSMTWYREVLNRPLFQWMRKTRFIRRLFVVPGLKDQGV